MKRNDYVILNDTIYRILAVDQDTYLVIDCKKKNMPTWVKRPDLSAGQTIAKEEAFNLLNIELSEEQLTGTAFKQAHKRYTMIAGVLSFMKDDALRCQAIKMAVDTYGISRRTLTTYLCNYLVTDNIASLVPKPRKTERPLTNDEKIMRWALNKFYYTRHKNSDILGWKFNNDTGDFEKLEYSCYEPFVDEYFSRYGDNLYIIDSGTVGLNAERIVNIASEYRINHLDEQFVVVVDYLQICGDANVLDRKTKTDDMVSLFKRLSVQMEIPVICISSIGRDGYKKRVSMDSFKESGNIEYGGGVCLGWNWYGETVNPYKGDEVMMDQYKFEGRRLMELDVLKSRNAERGTRVRFNYNPAYNYFEELLD